MTTDKGVWNLQDVRDKQLQSLWTYSGATESWVVGNNASGMLGQNQPAPNHRSSPVQVPGNTWGGPSSISHLKLSTGIGESWRMWIKTDGTLWGAGNASKVGSTHPSYPSWSSPKQVGSGTDWRSLSTSWAQTVATKTDGTMYSWGEQSYGELGQNNTSTVTSPGQVPGTTWGEFVATSSNSNVSMNIKTDGTLWAWGHNSFGGLGQNDRTQRSSPIQIPGDWSNPVDMVSKSVIKSDGTLWSWGYNRYGTLGQNEGSAPSYTGHRSSPTQIPGSWSRVARNTNVQLAIKTDGTLWGMGRNNQGQLAQNNLTDRSSPVQVGSDTTWSDVVVDRGTALAIKTDGTLWAWGDGNNYGAIGNNTRQVDYSSPVQIPGTDWKGVGAVNTNGWTAFKNN